MLTDTQLIWLKLTTRSQKNLARTGFKTYRKYGISEAFYKKYLHELVISRHELLVWTKVEFGPNFALFNILRMCELNRVFAICCAKPLATGGSDTFYYYQIIFFCILHGLTLHSPVGSDMDFEREACAFFFQRGVPCENP